MSCVVSCLFCLYSKGVVRVGVVVCIFVSKGLFHRCLTTVNNIFHCSSVCANFSLTLSM